MEIELNAEAKDRRLNRLVAVTVVLLSVFMAVCNIKDGNIVQAMQQAQSNAVDRWGEYQATKTKAHIIRTAQFQLAAAGMPGALAAVAAQRDFARESARYAAEAPALARQAQNFSRQYDALNVHDDQFDASEALVSTAVSLSAVAALTEAFAPLAFAWALGVMGVAMGICGFTSSTFDPTALSQFLG